MPPGKGSVTDWQKILYYDLALDFLAASTLLLHGFGVMYKVVNRKYFTTILLWTEVLGSKYFTIGFGVVCKVLISKYFTTSFEVVYQVSNILLLVSVWCSKYLAAGTLRKVF